MAETKETRIFIRLQKEKKQAWKRLCKARNISLSSFIIDSVEQKMLADERRKVTAFIEKQDNLFAKIGNNINQVAKYVNTQKGISSEELQGFNRQLEKLEELKKEQNRIFLMIYKHLADDH